MVNTKYSTSEDMVNKLQQLQRKTKLKFYKNKSKCYNEMKSKNFQTQQYPFSKIDQSKNKIYHKVILLRKFLQTKPQIKNMNIFYYDLYHTVIKVRDENRDIDNQHENDDNDYINFNDIVPNHYIGIKKNNEIL